MEEYEFPLPGSLSHSLSHWIVIFSMQAKPKVSQGLTSTQSRGGQEGTEPAAEVPWLNVWTDGLLALLLCESAKKWAFLLFRVLTQK